MKKPWVLIDVSYLAHRARFALKGMEYDDFPTGIIFGFFEQLRTICQNPKVKSNKVCLFFDSKKSYRRKAYPPYKRKRKDERTEEEKKQIEEMYFQVRLLHEQILPDIGIHTYRQIGLESDDLIAMAAQQISRRNGKAILITSDGDLYQCISPTVSWFDPGKDLLLTPESFLIKKGIEASRWGTVKALAGCSSDNVKGIKGIGEKTAIQFLTHTLPTNHKRYQAITSSEGVDIFNRNKKLVILPHKKTRRVKLKRPKYNPDAFFHYCERYGILSYLKGGKKREWLYLFNDNKSKGLRRRGDIENREEV